MTLIIKAEIGTTGETGRVEVSGVARLDIAEAIELEHPCHDEDCDIAQALEDGYPFWAANLLQGATETPLLDEVIAYYVDDGLDFAFLAESDRREWVATREA